MPFRKNGAHKVAPRRSTRSPRNCESPTSVAADRSPTAPRGSHDSRKPVGPVSALSLHQPVHRGSRHIPGFMSRARLDLSPVSVWADLLAWAHLATLVMGVVVAGNAGFRGGSSRGGAARVTLGSPLANRAEAFRCAAASTGLATQSRPPRRPGSVTATRPPRWRPDSCVRWSRRFAAGDGRPGCRGESDALRPTTRPHTDRRIQVVPFSTSGENRAASAPHLRILVRFPACCRTRQAGPPRIVRARRRGDLPDAAANRIDSLLLGSPPVQGQGKSGREAR